ncbi:plasmid partitioning protein RepB [Ochrobactrum soli]|uniref:Plasmid partitioning protein RepB n=1 Tax=Ochrobactrum soli TaxID=2448455 RepID=A0A849KT20_9HYPH|nr:plasmid partitioning protein RepB [[Ochrobactrum] soli]NNU62897.1 plasmid partitioning protein RepB [[Ochrobactrum] soli]
MKKSILKRMADAEGKTDLEDPIENSDLNPFSRRHSSPVISNVGRALSQLSEESIVSLDPNKIERSPFKDRFDNDAEADKELELLKASIAAEGQKIPVLVRPHPSKPGHYQLAYGYRRLAAVKLLMEESFQSEPLKIKAFIRELTDRQLIEEQSLENGVREGLTWIEQAMWALNLKNVGFSHRAICPILGLSEAAVSHLFKVSSTVPQDIIYAIGRAKSVGRPKWTALAEALKEQSRLEAIRNLISTDKFIALDSTARFAMVTSIAKASDGVNPVETREFRFDERNVGRMKSTSSGVVMTIPKQEAPFAEWLADRMPELFQEFKERPKA